MTAFPIHTIETAPEDSKPTLRHVQQGLGMIPNLAAGMAESPSLLKAFFAAREAYAGGTLTPVEIQGLSLANAYENGCAWCMAFHTAAARREGMSPESLEALRAGRDPAEPRLGALTRLSRALIRRHGDVSGPELEAFYAAGFGPAQALEVVLGAGFSVMANYAGHLVDAPLGSVLEPYAWSPPAR